MALVGILVVLSMFKSLSSGLGWAIIICLRGDLNVVFSQARIPSSHATREPHVPSLPSFGHEGVMLQGPCSLLKMAMIGLLDKVPPFMVKHNVLISCFIS